MALSFVPQKDVQKKEEEVPAGNQKWFCKFIIFSDFLSLIGEKVDIHTATISNRSWRSEMVSRIEKKWDE